MRLTAASEGAIAPLSYIWKALAAADDAAGFLLRGLEAAARLADARRLSRAQLPMDAVGVGQIGAAVDAVAVAFRIPAGNVELAGQRAGAHDLPPHAAAQRLARLGMDAGLGHDPARAA